MTDRECVAILQWALPRLGLRWRGFKNVRRQVCKRMGRRARELGLDASGYRARLLADAAELRRLDGFCRITISRFYRDRAVFRYLQDRLLPELVQASRARGTASLRVWSAGCASGEEPYTVAIILRLAVAPAFPGLQSEIVATDADAGLIERARRACYPVAALRDLPPEWIGQAFAAEGDERCLRPELRAGVELRCEDLRAQMPEGPFDLILCRNVAFTYFEQPLQEAVLARLVERLVPAGALVIGGHESLPATASELVRPEPGHIPVFRVGRTERVPRRAEVPRSIA